MSFGKSNVSAVILNALVAGKTILFGIRKFRVRTARNVGYRLIVTEATEGRIFGGERLVNPDIEFGFIERPDRRVYKIVATVRVVCVRELDTGSSKTAPTVLLNN